MPAFVSTLCICIVFAPIAFITGAAKSLFVPMALAVVFAMLMSYVLSRTLVPTMIHYLLAEEATSGHAPGKFSAAFDRAFDRVRARYGGWLAWSLQHRVFVVVVFTLFVAGSLAMLPLIGRDFFPTVDAGLIAIDRTQAQRAGLSERDVASDLLVSLASSGQVAPSYWIDKRGVQYLVSVQTPQYAIDSIDALKATPISNTAGDPQTVGNLSTITRGFGPANITHYNVARTYDVLANVADTDLGSVSDGVKAAVAAVQATAPPVMARSVDHLDGAARRARRHRVDAVFVGHRRCRCRH